MSARYQPVPLPRVAALYPRVSDPAQDRDDKTSLKTQEAGERAWALANGYVAKPFTPDELLSAVKRFA